MLGNNREAWETGGGGGQALRLQEKLRISYDSNFLSTGIMYFINIFASAQRVAIQ